MKEGRGGGKEREAPTHLIENSKLTHAVCVTKNKHGSGQTQPRTMRITVQYIRDCTCELISPQPRVR